MYEGEVITKETDATIRRSSSKLEICSKAGVAAMKEIPVQNYGRYWRHEYYRRVLIMEAKYYNIWKW